ncbi:HisA/HisF-related TIM barrel protein, partial [Bacteroides rodentium]
KSEKKKKKKSIGLDKLFVEELSLLYVLVSGGVSCADDIRQLEAAGIPAVIFGKALYEGRITFKELENFVS